MSSHSLHASHPSTFRAPGWGAPAVLPSCHHWRNATSRKLVPFSHRSASRIFIRQPGCIPSPTVTQDSDHQLDGGQKRAGLRPLPLPQPQGCSSSVLGRGVSRGSRKRFLRRRDSRRHPRADLQLYGLGSLSSPLERGRGRGACRSSVRPEVIAAAVWPPGAEVVVAAAGASVGEPPRVSSPRRPSNVGGCSYLRGWNRSSVCNGTLSAGVCSLWLSGPKHVWILA
jgi:hypothetical protein